MLRLIYNDKIVCIKHHINAKKILNIVRESLGFFLISKNMSHIIYNNKASA